MMTDRGRRFVDRLWLKIHILHSSKSVSAYIDAFDGQMSDSSWDTAPKFPFERTYHELNIRSQRLTTLLSRSYRDLLQQSGKKHGIFLQTLNKNSCLIFDETLKKIKYMKN